MSGVKLLCWSLATAGSLLCGRPMEGQSQPAASDSSRVIAFDRLDRTSRLLIATVRCALTTGQARADGLFGPPDSVGRSGHCLRKDSRAFGVFFNSDTTFRSAQQLRVVDLAAKVRYLGPVDTAAILAESRAGRDAFFKGYLPFKRDNRQFAPFSIRTEGDSIEVWLLPAGLLMGNTPSAIGGERAFIYSPDGRTFAREIDAYDRHRAVTIPDSGRVEILSLEEDLPLVSELVVANLLHGRGREVSIVTKAYDSQLRGADPNSVWFQIRR